MCEAQLAGHPELWGTHIPESRGPEGNLKMWQEAESYLDHLCNMAEAQPNEAINLALVDAYNRCIEERRRAEDLLKLHKAWAKRGVGGVEELESPVRDQP